MVAGGRGNIDIPAVHVVHNQRVRRMHYSGIGDATAGDAGAIASEGAIHHCQRTSVVDAATVGCSAASGSVASDRAVDHREAAPVAVIDAPTGLGGGVLYEGAVCHRQLGEEIVDAASSFSI